MRLLVSQTGQPKLLQVIFTLGLPGRLAGRLYGRHQQAEENANDRNDSK